MSRLLEIRQRIHTVENIQRITRTLATVAAARLSRTRRRAAGLRAYSAAFREILSNQWPELVTQQTLADADLLRERQPVRRVALLLVTADRGMCGGYNLEACRVASARWERARVDGCTVRFLVIGRKGKSYLSRHHGEILHHESWRRGGVTATDVERLLGIIVALYRKGDVDAVDVVYTEFRSAIHRRARAIRLLPMSRDLDASGENASVERWVCEPSPAVARDGFVMLALRVQLHALLYESLASEQGARMVTMEEATERADKALRGYRVQHHRLRREGITLDLLGALLASRMRGAAALGGAAHD